MAKTTEGIKDDRDGAYRIRCGGFPDLICRLFGKMWSEPAYQIRKRGAQASLFLEKK